MALSVGAIQAWATRFTMNPDGVSYLDIGDAYWRGDWHHAINAYWNPLYSWILGFFIKALKPTPYWEYPLVHLVNFLIFAATLACFEFFLVAFIPLQTRRNRQLHDRGEVGIPGWGWYLLGYSIFVWTSLVLVGVWIVTPDMLVFLFICLDCALLLRTRENPNKANFLLFGVALGFGYFAKSILFPLAFVFLITAALATRRDRRLILSVSVFLVAVVPFVAAISVAKHRLTFGESGRLSYAAYVGDLEPWYPGDGGDFYPEGIGHAENINKPSQFGAQLLHPVKKIVDQPATYFFDGPIQGTYPFWYDVSYWQDGIRPVFRSDRELVVIRYSLVFLAVLTWGLFYQLLVTIPLLLLFLLAPRPSVCFRSAAKEWPILLPCAAGVFAYAIVHLEFRYIAPFACLSWVAFFSGVRLPNSKGLAIVVRFLVLLIAISQLALAVNDTLKHEANKNIRRPIHAKAVSALKNIGFAPGAKIALISDQPWGEGGPFVARLLRVQIIAQVNDPKEFWNASPEAQAKVLDAFVAVGADAALSWKPQNPSSEWKRLGDTSYFLLRLDPGSRNATHH